MTPGDPTKENTGRGGRRHTVRILGLVVLGLVVVSVAGWVTLRPPVLAVPRQGLVLSDVTVVNPGRDRRPQQTVTIAGATITRITDSRSATAPDTHTRGFAGAYVLPGLIDMHVHFASYPDRDLFAVLFLAHGVTTVRDTGNFDGSIWQTRQAILEEKSPGPRIFACGPILDGEPPIWPGSRVVRTAEEAQAAVAEVAAQGASCVKVYSRLSPLALAAIRDAAGQHGLPVIGHVPLAVPFAEARISDVQHLTGVPPPPQSSIWNLNLVAGIAHTWQALDPARIDAIVRASAEQGIAHTPTMVVMDRLTRVLDLQQHPDATALLLPRYYRELLWSPQEGLPYLRNLAAEDEKALAAEMRKIKHVVRRLHEAGVRLHVGSDTFNPFVVPGASLHEELQHFVDAGFTPEEVWATATREAGAWLGAAQLGTVAEGAPADLLIFREDPTRTLTALSTLEAVVAQGRLYSKEMLDQALARYRTHFEGRVYDTVTMAIARYRLQQRADNVD